MFFILFCVHTLILGRRGRVCCIEAISLGEFTYPTPKQITNYPGIIYFVINYLADLYIRTFVDSVVSMLCVVTQVVRSVVSPANFVRLCAPHRNIFCIIIYSQKFFCYVFLLMEKKILCCFFFNIFKMQNC